ncbi:MAG: LPS export ABC transporter periplasmic protein LptC [Steroidobacteraceae bacterium]
MIARILLLAGLLALVAALVQWRIVEREPVAAEGQAMRPGYYLTGVDLEEFGADGQLRIGLQSITATEDPASGVVRLADVAVDYHAPTGRVWHLTSNEAHVPPGGRTVEFEGDVRLAGQPGEDPVAAELHTARLQLDTVAEIADTRAPVELAFGAHRVRALGMRADLKAGTVRLESDVHGRFTP